jgi:YD repeat-containing protein
MRKFITSNTKYNNQKPLRQARQRLAWALLLIYTFTQFTPGFVAVAAPQVFTRIDAGVSSMPLGVMNFNAPGFGEYADAVNVANGSVYADMGAVSRNNTLKGGDETANSIGGSQWQLKDRLRLNGFARNVVAIQDNLITNQNPADAYWDGYFAKPLIGEAYRLLPNDGGCGGSNKSGLLRVGAELYAGATYTFSFWGRADSNLQVWYGMNDATGQNVTLTPTWQQFSMTIVPTAGRAQADRVFEIFENVANNPAWEVRNLLISLYMNPSPLADLSRGGIFPPPTDAFYSGYCTKPAIEILRGFQSYDNPNWQTNGGQYYSGITRAEPFGPGTYVVSVKARTLSGTLPIGFGLQDGYSVSKTLNTTWQTFTEVFAVPQGATQGRIFQIFEATQNNPAWEIKDISVRQSASTAATMVLSSGDGGTKIFNRVVPPNLAWFNDKPSWIQRYKGTSDTQPVRVSNCINDLYSLAPKNSTQYSAEYLYRCTRLNFDNGGPNGTMRLVSTDNFMHYFTADGTRVTFYNDGEYADYIQTPHQQYRGAKYNSDPDGVLPWNAVTGTGTPKTELKYTSVTPTGSSTPITGLLSRVTDEWGRVSDYHWFNDGTLNAIHSGLLDPNNTNTWVRGTAFQYVNVGNQRLISAMYQGTLDGKSNKPDGTDKIWRVTQFEYELISNANVYRVVLKKIRRQVLSGQAWRETRYTYDSLARVTSVKQTTADGTLLEPEMTYTYNGGGNSVVTNSHEVVVQQGAGTERKVTKYYFNPTTGQLLQKNVRDYNPWAAGGYWGTHATKNDGNELVWKYEYYDTGSTSKITSPSGKYDQYFYDAKGNVSRVDTHLNGGQRERSKVFAYDNDNRMVYDGTPAESGTRANSSYAYDATALSTWYENHSMTVNGQLFQATSKKVSDQYVANTLKHGRVWLLDEYGRLTSDRRYSGTATGNETTYTYHGGTTYGPWNPNWTQRTPVKQYGDLVYRVKREGLDPVGTDHFYDEFGNVTIKIEVGALGSDINNDNTVVADVANNRKDRVYMQGFNGFGQKVFERKYEYGRQSTETQWYYYSTGELDWSYQNHSQNITDYGYHLSGANMGRVSGVSKGVGTNSGITTLSESTTFNYDAYGRVSSQNVDGVNTTSFQYDTLNRTTVETRQDGHSKVQLYHSTGTPNVQCGLGGPGRLEVAKCEYKTVDSLGRVTENFVHSNPAGHLSGVQGLGFTILYTYDPLDRLIKVNDGRLTMNDDNNAARATFMKYESLGNLIKVLGPALRTSTAQSAAYYDSRRPYTEFEYDGFNRKVKETKLLRATSVVSPSSMVMPSATDTVTGNTTWSYDAWDRVFNTKNADGYWTEFSYDALGNMTRKHQQVCPTAANCDSFSDEDGVGDGFATSRYAYDASSKPTWTKDARGNVSRIVYDTWVAQPTQIIDARGITTKIIHYRADALPIVEYEPDNDPATPATGDASNGYKITKQYEYGSRGVPIKVYRPYMDTVSGAVTQYQYDWAKRITTTTLPDGATVTQSYDAYGNVMDIKDPDGFVTQYTYDAYNRLVKEFKPKRVGNAVDEAAFPGVAGLENIYKYDEAGNLWEKLERGLYTTYRYNSLGKVQAETRPYTPNAAIFWKYNGYRLDSEKVLESTYGLGETSGIITSVLNHGRPDWVSPNVTGGNLQQYFLTAGGKRSAVISFGASSLGSNVWEKSQYQTFNGLGQMVQRNHIGNSNIYTNFYRKNGATLNLPHHAQLWRYDANNNLLRTYKRALDANGNFDDGFVCCGQVASDNYTDKYEYGYSRTNKEITRKSNVDLYIKGEREGSSRLVASTSSKGALATSTNPSRNGAVASPQAVTDLTYDDADRLESVITTDTDVLNQSTVRSSQYYYFVSGQKRGVDVWATQARGSSYQGSQNFTYDTRGRMVSQVDGNGDRTAASVTTTTNYWNDGSSQRVLSNGRLNLVIKPTIGGLAGNSEEVETPNNVTCPSTDNSGNANGSCTTKTNFVYNAIGQITQQNILVTGTTPNTLLTKNITPVYDSFGNITSADGVTTTYDLNSAVTSITNANDSSQNRSYALDSRGNRLQSSDWGAQRLDAEERVVSARTALFSGPPCCFGWPRPSYYRTDARAYAYDPRGDLLLDGSIRIVEHVGTGNDGVKDPTELHRKNRVTVAIDGQPQFIHQTVSARGKRVDNNIFVWWSTDISTTENLDFDETFSLADSVRWESNENWDISKVKPYTFLQKGEAQALEAPVKPTSVQTGITSASSVTSPNSTPPSTNNGSASSVTKPDAKPEPKPEDPKPATTNGSSPAQSQGVSSPALGTTSSTGTTTTSTSSTPSAPSVSSPTPGTTTTTTAGESTSSQPQSSSNANINALEKPPTQSSTTITASSVTAPTSSTPVNNLPGSASSVTKPGASASNTSSTPSASTVSSPSGSTPSSNGNGSSVTPPGGGKPEASAGSTGNGVKPLGVTIGDRSPAGIACLKRVEDSLNAKADITNEEAEKLMGNLEACAREEAEDELTSQYTAKGFTPTEARIQARADLDALDAYFQASDFTPRDRIQAYTGLAVGLAKGEITLAEWRSELAELCGMRAKANGGGSKTCDNAFAKFGGRDGYMPGPGCPIGQGALATNPCKNYTPKPTNNKLTGYGQKGQFMEWLFGKGGYNWNTHTPTGKGVGGQLSKGSALTIGANAKQAFHSIHEACKRGRKASAQNPQTGSAYNISLNGPQAEGYFNGFGVQFSAGSTAEFTTKNGLQFDLDPNDTEANFALGFGYQASPESISVNTYAWRGYESFKLSASLTLWDAQFELGIGDNGYWEYSLTYDPYGVGTPFSGSLSMDLGKGCW